MHAKLDYKSSPTKRYFTYDLKASTMFSELKVQENKTSILHQRKDVSF